MELPCPKNIRAIIPIEGTKHTIKVRKRNLKENSSSHIDLGGYRWPPTYLTGSKNSFPPW
jgi:hypothetical protein